MTDTADAARANLARQQGELARALMVAGPVPEGFDASRVAVLSKDLRDKRSRWAARSRPALAHVVGTSWDAAFARYSRANPGGATGPGEDADGFAQWLSRTRHAGVATRRLPGLSAWRLRLQPRERLVRLAFATLVGALLVFAGVTGFQAIDEGIDELAATGTSVGGTVVEVGGSLWGGLLVSFGADGRQVTTRVWTRGDDYAAGDSVVVVYDAGEPTRAQVDGDVDEGPWAWFWVSLLATGAGVLGYALVLVVGALRALVGRAPVESPVDATPDPVVRSGA